MHVYSETQPALFNMHSTEKWANQDLAAATTAAERVTREQFAAQTDEQLTEGILADHVSLTPVHLDADDRQIAEREVEELGGVGTTTMLDLHIPFRGNLPSVMNFRPSRSPDRAVYGRISGSSIVFTFSINESPAQVENRISSQIALLQSWVDALNFDIEGYKRKAGREVLARLQQRRQQKSRSQGLITALDIPIKKAPPERSLELPVIRRRVTPVRSATDSREWQLPEVLYEQILVTIIHFAHALERRPKSAHGLIPGEETLRDWLIFFLSSTYETGGDDDVFIGGETLNGAGKTDILIHHKGRNAFIGECKFWDGEKVCTDAIDQLLSYLVWRDTKAALILFIRQKGVQSIIDKADRCIREHPQFVAADDDPAEPYRRRDYTLASTQDHDRKISVALIPIVVPAK